jgi:hypothetical protein
LKRLKDRLLRKSVTLILSIGILCLVISCGKKGNPLPKQQPVPGGIGELSGEVKDGVLFISFAIPTKNMDGSDVVDLAGFKIQKSCVSCGGTFEAFKEIRLDEEKGFAIASNRVYIYDDNLVSGQKYSYMVSPFTSKGAVGDSSKVFSIQWQDPPGKPSGTVAVTVNDGMVELSWLPEPGFSYNVYRHDNGVYPLFPLNRDLLASPFFVETGLKNGQKYTYEVRKVKVVEKKNWEGEGLRVEATPIDLKPPVAPGGVKAEKRGSVVQVSWLQNKDDDAAGYNVYRVIGRTEQKLTKTPIKDTIFIDHTVGDNRYLSYYVTSVDLSGNESEPSREIIIILKE